jgi:hypothetical protein
VAETDGGRSINRPYPVLIGFPGALATGIRLTRRELHLNRPKVLLIEARGSAIHCFAAREGQVLEV